MDQCMLREEQLAQPGNWESSQHPGASVESRPQINGAILTGGECQIVGFTSSRWFCHSVPQFPHPGHLSLQTHRHQCAQPPQAAQGGWGTSGEEVAQGSVWHPLLCREVPAAAGRPVVAWPGCYQPSQCLGQRYCGEPPPRGTSGGLHELQCPHLERGHPPNVCGGIKVVHVPMHSESWGLMSS